MGLRGFCSAVSTAAIMAGWAAQPAMAQDSRDQSAGSAPIVVTGTLIRGVTEDAFAPVDVIMADDLLQQGAPSLLDLIRKMPVSSGILGDSSQFDPRTQFNEGAASVNLRGLGPQRTLALLNGKRMVSSGAGNVPLVDINLMPSGAIGRIDMLKDGAAATYGSDAIAGVVNFITRTDQDGFLASGDYRHIDGSNGDWTGALSWGGNLGPVRLFLSGGYQRRSELTVADRDYALRPYAENPQGGWSGGGNPGNFDFNGAQGGLAFTADEGCKGLGAFRSVTGSANDLCFGNYVGLTNLIEPEERYQLFADLAVPLGDRVELRVTGLYGRTMTELNTSPSFLPTISPSAESAFGGRGLFVIPSYAPALIDYCARFGDAAGCALDGSGNPTESALAYPVRFRPMLLSGNMLFDNERRTARLKRDSDAYQFTAELRGDLGRGLELTGGVTYSEYDRYFQVGDSSVDLLQNALAGFGGADCAYASPASRAGLSQAQLAALAGTNGCSWFNPFSTALDVNTVTGIANPNYAGNGAAVDGLSTQPGAGLVNDVATIGDFYNIWGRTANTRQMVGDLVLSGRSGIQLPGGEVSFALGGQFRHDRYARTYEGGNNLDLFPCPGSVLNPDASCNPETGALGFIGSNRNVAVAQDVWAAFAELQLPVTERLQVQLAARVENYGGAIGSTFDPQARLRYELADGVILRGGVGTTFRGPPPQNTAADLVVLTFIGGAFRAVDILANPDLRPERATTWNAGLVVDRGGFRANIDYWRYDFSGAIESEPVAGIVAAMFGSTGNANCGNPDYAALQARFIFSGGVCSSANIQRLMTYSFNAADVSTSGVDFSASYDARLGDVALQAGIGGSHVIDYRVGQVMVEGVVVQQPFDAAGKLNYQTTAYPIPQWKGQAWLQALRGGHALRLQLNYVDGYTDDRGAAVFGPDANLGGASVTAGKHVDSYTTLDLSWRWTLETGTTLSLVLANLLDQEPPFARLDHSFDPLTADALGFTVKAGFSQRF
ncbi:TonB-dependent receptor [Altererythrobacter xixiisoli]|uniref:TonB-dependent receptor n=1 Tax=Croceibacterium xixiisoli TaxID=1476466 RepID=A0A6I4TRJ5_9SPHN|nr:TonB-dependent receptor [Croceibacterium xixiisoli]MXO98494.1 TonB-dependent receptor [Croceibacterium xixiisoli]